jgi:hypothetical protein
LRAAWQVVKHQGGHSPTSKVKHPLMVCGNLCMGSCVINRLANKRRVETQFLKEFLGNL